MFMILIKLFCFKKKRIRVNGHFLSDSFFLLSLFFIFLQFDISVHPCDDEEYGGCSHICEKDGDEAVCKCPPLMKLIKPDNKKCEPGRSRIFDFVHTIFGYRILPKSLHEPKNQKKKFWIPISLFECKHITIICFLGFLENAHKGLFQVRDEKQQMSSSWSIS